MIGTDHVLGVGALVPDRAVGIDDDLVDGRVVEERPQRAELMFGMACYQNTRSRLTKMVRRSPCATLIVGAMRR